MIIYKGLTYVTWISQYSFMFHELESDKLEQKYNVIQINSSEFRFLGDSKWQIIFTWTFTVVFVIIMHLI